PVTTTYGDDGDGNQTSVQTPNGNTTTAAYDHLGRASSTTQPSVTIYTGGSTAPVTSASYDLDGNAVSTTDATGGVSHASYDPLGRLVASGNQLGETTVFTYTATELAAQRDPLGNVTSYGQYDAAGRLGQVQDGSGRTQQFGYDNAGNLTSITWGNASSPTRTEARTYDALSELSTDAISGPSTTAQTTTYSYDLHGNLVRQAHANGDVTFTSYDLANDATSGERDPNNALLPTHSSQETLSQDQAANTNKASDWDSRATQLTIDPAGRVTQGTNSLGGATISTTSTFDPNGNALTLGETAGSTSSTASFSYNAANWATSSTDNSLTTSYGYDAAGRLRTFSTAAPGYATISLGLNAAGLATSISDGTSATSITRNADDFPTQISLPGSVNQHGQYDGANRTTHVDAIGPTGVSSPLNNAYDYGYDAAGWTNGITTTVSGSATTLAVSHDALGHLTGATGTGTTGSWAYANLGDNLTGATSNGSPTTSYSYSSSNANELASTTTSGVTTYYGNDQRAHFTSISPNSTNTCPTDSASTCLSYDGQGRLTTVTKASGL
ncbi:MAG: hypothetical protein P4L86_17990, partial [Mycobacterium sp.]|nr:hypothetical protein [Mycobacterium sp.]